MCGEAFCIEFRQGRSGGRGRDMSLLPSLLQFCYSARGGTVCQWAKYASIHIVSNPVFTTIPQHPFQPDPQHLLQPVTLTVVQRKGAGVEPRLAERAILSGSQ